jgi:endonuclease/exonuclease/phosphatase family metal-dependent hydrolase
LAKEQSAPSRQEWDWKLDRAAAVIAEMKPTIMALQEVENRSVLRRLTKLLADRHKLSYRVAYIEGWDSYTEQDVGLIYRSGLVEFSFREQSREMFASQEYYNMNKHLFARFQWGPESDREELLLMNVHLRATPEQHEIREKQCRLIRQWINDAVNRGDNVVMLGDINTEEGSDQVRPGSDMSILLSAETESTDDDLIDLNSHLAPNQRASHISERQHDRILVSRSLLEDARGRIDLQFSRIGNFQNLVIVGNRDEDHFNRFYEIPQNQRDISDHYPIMAEFKFK